MPETLSIFLTGQTSFAQASFLSYSNNSVIFNDMLHFLIKLCKAQHVTNTPGIASTFVISRSLSFLNFHFRSPNALSISILVELWAELNIFSTPVKWPLSRNGLSNNLRGVMQNLPKDETSQEFLYLLKKRAVPVYPGIMHWPRVCTEHILKFQTAMWQRTLKKLRTLKKNFKVR